MEFTPQEMELLCVLHAGTRRATLELLESAAPEADQAGRLMPIRSAVEKLRGLPDDEPVALAFQPEG